MNNIGHDAKEMLDAIDERSKLLEKKMNIKIEGNEEFAGVTSSITRDDMNEIAEKWDLGKLSKLKKNEFAEVIKEEIINNVKEKLTKTEELVLEVLNKILENNGVIHEEKAQELPEEIVFYLKNNGILFVGKDDNEKRIIFMPVDIREAIDAAVKDGDIINRANENSLILRIVRGLIYYNGIIELDSLVDFINKLTQKEFDVESVKAVISENEHIFADLRVLENLEGLEKYTMIASSKLSNPVQMIQAQNANGLDYHGFKGDDILEAGEINYCEWDEAHNKLFKYITDNYDVSEAEAAAVVSAVIFGLKDGAGIEENLNVLDACFIFQSAGEKKTFEKMLVAVQNYTRLWALRGHMPSEFKVETVVKKDKVGRNEPCPCGSGKKFKKCCGK